MKIKANENQIQITGYGKYNQTVRFILSERTGTWFQAREGRRLEQGSGMTLSQVIRWAEVTGETNGNQSN